ncbi:MAG: hypothetical protein ACODAD_01935 [Planctomycetota bacterium]
MFKQTFLAARIIVSFAAIGQAQQSTDAEQMVAEEPQLAPDAVSEIERAPSSPALSRATVIADIQGNHYFEHATSYTPRRHYGSNPTWREKCAYYRSVRQSFSSGPCCATAPSQFGPLWSNYCADKQAVYGGHHAAVPAAHPGIHSWQGSAPSSQTSWDGCDTTEISPTHTRTESGKLTEPSLDIGEPPDPNDVHSPDAAWPRLEDPGKSG